MKGSQPTEPPPSRYAMLRPETAPPHGCLAAGGDLDQGRSSPIAAASSLAGSGGAACGGRPTRGPSCRSTAFMNRGVSTPQTARRLRVTRDAACGAVIAGCAERAGGRGSRPRCAGPTSACTALAGPASRSGTVERSSVGLRGHRESIPSRTECVEGGAGRARLLVGGRAVPIAGRAARDGSPADARRDRDFPRRVPRASRRGASHGPVAIPRSRALFHPVVLATSMRATLPRDRKDHP